MLGLCTKTVLPSPFVIIMFSCNWYVLFSSITHIQCMLSRNYVRLYPALINCTTIDWFKEWPREALLEVADKYLANVNILDTISEVSTYILK